MEFDFNFLPPLCIISNQYVGGFAFTEFSKIKFGHIVFIPYIVFLCKEKILS